MRVPQGKRGGGQINLNIAIGGIDEYGLSNNISIIFNILGYVG
jgi:hypothetical protein